MFVGNDRKKVSEEFNELFEDIILEILSQDDIERELLILNDIVRKYHSKMLIIESQENILRELIEDIEE